MYGPIAGLRGKAEKTGIGHLDLAGEALNGKSRVFVLAVGAKGVKAQHGLQEMWDKYCWGHLG